MTKTVRSAGRPALCWGESPLKKGVVTILIPRVMFSSREATGEALTGARVGCPRYSREIFDDSVADRLGRVGKATLRSTLPRVLLIRRGRSGGHVRMHNERKLGDVIHAWDRVQAAKGSLRAQSGDERE